MYNREKIFPLCLIYSNKISIKQVKQKKKKKMNIISDLDNFSGDSGGDFGEWSVGRKDIMKNLYKTGKFIYTLGLK